jgi:hypothetical protein
MLSKICQIAQSDSKIKVTSNTRVEGAGGKHALSPGNRIRFDPLVGSRQGGAFCRVGKVKTAFSASSHWDGVGGSTWNCRPPPLAIIISWNTRACARGPVSKDGSGTSLVILVRPPIGRPQGLVVGLPLGFAFGVCLQKLSSLWWSLSHPVPYRGNMQFARFPLILINFRDIERLFSL